MAIARNCWDVLGAISRRKPCSVGASSYFFLSLTLAKHLFAARVDMVRKSLRKALYGTGVESIFPFRSSSHMVLSGYAYPLLCLESAEQTLLNLSLHTKTFRHDTIGLDSRDDENHWENQSIVL